MADKEKVQQPPTELPDFSFHIWPPSDRIRGAVTRHLIQTLSTPSSLTNRFSTLSIDDAKVAAKSIEEASFSAASSAAIANDGIEMLQLYSKEISKRMLEVVKRAKENVSGDGFVSTENV